jgi:hypothetical protein
LVEGAIESTMACTANDNLAVCLWVVGEADIVEMLDVINVSAGTADMSSGLIT